jgi:hypothetical protein
MRIALPTAYYTRGCDTGALLSVWLTLPINEWRGHLGPMVSARQGR